MSAPHESPTLAAELRFYEELNDFLPPALRKRSFAYAFTGTPSVKDVIEAIGVPHAEVDLVLVDGASVDFARRLVGGERVAVYPVFERFDIAPITRLRPRGLRQTRFILDVHLGKLARHLRLLGFDALYRNDYDDPTIVKLAREDKRIILTRDKGLLKRRAVTHGYWLRETEPRRQTDEVLRAFDLRRSVRPLTRCLACNGELQKIAKAAVTDRLPPRVRDGFDDFAGCRACGRVYWPGSHYRRLRRVVDALAGTCSEVP
jgi:uncharacterized protein with PIN domain